MTKSHEDVPQDADMRQIPRWARVALVGRVLRRVQPLLLACWPDATEEFQCGVEWAIAEGELAASQAAATADLKSAGMAAMDVYGKQPMNSGLPAGYIAFAAARVSFSAREPQAGSAQFGIKQAAWALYWYEFNQKAKGVTNAAVTAIWSDYARLLSISRRDGWNQNTPVPADVFGPMWPKGPPKNWPKGAPQRAPLKPKPKRAKPKSKHLDLPKDAIDFLRSGEQFKFVPSSAECGLVTLKPFAHLCADEFTIRTEGTPAERDDPHRGEEGCYVLRVVDLIGECDAYGPDGLLAWFPDYQMFGSYDEDHHRAIVFADATWTEIVANPAKFLDAQWNAPGRFAKYVHEPWKHCDFRAD